MSTAPTSHGPHLPLPVRLQFGSDPGPSFSGSQSHDSLVPRTGLPPISTHEKLPSVSQLLTPTSQGQSEVQFRRPLESLPEPRPRGSLPPGGINSHEYPPISQSYSQPPYRGHGQYNVGRGPSSSASGNYADGSSRGQPHFPQGYPTSPSYQSPPPLRHSNNGQSPDGTRSFPSHSAPRSELRTVTKPVKKVVREENIPGEGPCYVYEDGTRVRKTIDGEAVNATWGITKAGKPRKRLAIACITCREKKIKCEPAEPKCVQCEKSGRDCRFQTAVRNQFRDPRTPSYEQQAPIPAALNSPKDKTIVTVRSDAPNELPVLSVETSAVLEKNPASVGKKRIASVSEEAKMSEFSKKPKHNLEEKGPPYEEQLTQLTKLSLNTNLSNIQPELNLIPDPHYMDSETVMHYADEYFAKYNSGRYNLFPKALFLNWLVTCKSKTSEDLVVLYSILAVGSIYSGRKNASKEGAKFYKIALEEVAKNQGNFTLQIVQCRLHLSFYCFAIGDYSVGWEICGSAFRVAIALRMHIEAPDNSDDHDESTPFDFPSSVLNECYRRTFWNCFVYDRFQSFCLEHVLTIQKEDIFVRLPCDDASYAKNLSVETPYLDNGTIDESMTRLFQKETTGISPMVFLIEIMALAGDVLQQAHRSSYRSASAYTSTYETFYTDMNKRLELWYRSLPQYFHMTFANMKSSLEKGYNDTFSAAHIMFHLVIVILNCRVRRSLFSKEQICRNTETSWTNCERIFSILRMMLTATSSLKLPETPESPDQVTKSNWGDSDPNVALGVLTPFIGHAVYYATDIISSAGLLKDDYVTGVLEMLDVAIEISDRLFKHYAVVKGQCRNIRRRIQTLRDAAENGSAEAQAWRFESNLQTARSDEFCLFYGEASSKIVLDIVGMPIKPYAVLKL